jgi:pimeloyl-ACP methyl ester carboxylesterase
LDLIHVDPPGCDVALVTRGAAGGGPPRGTVLFLHGLGDAASMFAPALELPSLADFDIALIDLPGHGLSDKPVNFDYAPASHAAVVFSAAQRARLGRPLHLVGFSFGAAVAVELARFPPLGVASVTLCEPALEADRMSFAKLVVARPEQDFVDVYADLLAGFATPSSPEADRRWAETAAFASARSVWRCSRGALDAAQRGELLAHFADLSGAKTLILTPDTLDKWGRAHQLAGAGARIVEVSSPSKMPMYDAPEAFYDAVSRAVRAA